MRWFRTRGSLLNLVIAAVFGFMSLGHGPVMSFAHADQAAAQSIHSHSAAHHQHDHDMAASSLEPADADAGSNGPAAAPSPPACQAFGCFVLMSPACIAAATVIAILIDTLSPRPVEEIVPAALEPADPPPRPHV